MWKKCVRCVLCSLLKYIFLFYYFVYPIKSIKLPLTLDLVIRILSFLVHMHIIAQRFSMVSIGCHDFSLYPFSSFSMRPRSLCHADSVVLSRYFSCSFASLLFSAHKLSRFHIRLWYSNILSAREKVRSVFSTISDSRKRLKNINLTLHA